jgi:hypothetical protein
MSRSGEKNKGRKPDWSEAEIEATVADYFEMLEMEVRGREYSKSEHRQRLILQLNGRSEGAVERKHQNVSAVLQEMGLRFIEGYKPLGNVQGALRPVIERYVRKQSMLFGRDEKSF